LVDWLFIQVKSLYSLLPERIYEIPLLSVFRFYELAETNILSFEVKGIENSPVFVLFEICLTSVQEIATLVLPAEGKDKAFFFDCKH
jgi:hypothetical protein